MNRYFALILLLACMQLGGQTRLLQKYSHSNLPRRHPYSDLLRQPISPAEQYKSKSATSYNRLLVLLVDFQEEMIDNPLTTGNGKFLLESDPAYLYSIASPPHNREYFTSNLEALRYYYLAASAGSYELQYDIYPQDGSFYTLPQDMVYYNPPGANSELFVSRIEEYFQTAFQIADTQSPEIDFSSYDHYMIIHAGSDWQHDVLGNSPGDLPSFFIRVGDQKAVTVDNGNHTIYHACNVPSTISQDFRESSSGDYLVRSGYGALNAVMAHEFGHSLGLVDLYNVRTFQPMVGFFDIMDSGGSGVMLDGPLEDGSYVAVEGILPALPGAYSRMLLFEDQFRARGLMVDSDQINSGTTINLAASSRLTTEPNPFPQIIKIPLSDNEYVLIENRSVDPDGDGATAVVTGLAGRVVLYPSPIDDPNNTPSYEYDYLLPSFIKIDGSSVGGGILAWHVNEDIIYNQGTTFSNGEWISNFDNNTVNIVYNYRGVRVIEADNLPDLGNEYSWYWTGTPFEYFHKNRPEINSQNGLFVQWSQDLWKPSFSSLTTPALQDSKGLGSQNWLEEISNPAAIMSFKIRDSFFDRSQIIQNDSLFLVAPLLRHSLSISDELPVVFENKVAFLSQPDSNGAWVNQLGDFQINQLELSNPIVSANQYPDSYPEIVLTGRDYLTIIDIVNDDFQQHRISFQDSITTLPVALDNSLFVATGSSLYKVQNYDVVSVNNDLGNIKAFTGYNNRLVAMKERSLYELDSDLQIIDHVILPESFGLYDPLTYQSEAGQNPIFILTSNSGNIYTLSSGVLSRIFRNTSTNNISQLALSTLGEYSPVIVFGRSNEAFAITLTGSLIPGFPSSLYPQLIEEYAYPKALRIDDAEILYYPIKDRGYAAVRSTGQQVSALGLFWDIQSFSDIWQWQPSRNELIWYYPSRDNRLQIKTLMGITENPIIWSGFRNNGTGIFVHHVMNPTLQDEHPPLEAFVFPNPVRGDLFRIRLQNEPAGGSYSIFDVSGNRVQEGIILPYNSHIRDIEIFKRNLSSGVYYILVKAGNQSKLIRFAIEK